MKLNGRPIYSSVSAVTEAILAYTRQREIQSPIDRPRPPDPLIEARAQVRALEVKCAKLQDENSRLKRERASKRS